MTFDPWHLIHILWAALGGVLVFFGKKALRNIEEIEGRKVDKSTVERAVDTLVESINKLDSEQKEMHKENSQRLDSINQTLLNIVGGRYGNKP